MNRERERIGPFVVTDMANLSPNGIVCAHCDKQLSIGRQTNTRHRQKS